MILVLVDDLLWVGSKHFKSQVIDPFTKKFKVFTVFDDCFDYVGLEIKQDKHGVLLSLKKYAK